MAIAIENYGVVYDPATGHFTRAGERIDRQRKDGYHRVKLGEERFLAHRAAFLFMTGEWPAELVDHINGDRGDNRWSNLRPASLSENQWNQFRAQRGNGSGLLGVSRMSRHRPGFYARIAINGHSRYLGTFKTAEEAHAAYLAAKAELHPETFLARSA